MRIKRLVALALEGARPTRAAAVLNGFLLALIALNLLAMVLESVASIREAAPALFDAFEWASLSIFAVEYVARVWSCTALSRYAGPLGRLRFVLTPMALIDLVAIFPLLVPALGLDLRAARTLRLFRVFRVFRLARYTRAVHLFARVFSSRRSDLALSMFVMAALLLVASSAMYYAENHAQPDQFSSIPATFWWAIATLTTVGYGDVYPVTALGKALAGVICVLGIAMFALPTSILGAAFVKELGDDEPSPRCPHCDHPLDDVPDS